VGSSFIKSACALVCLVGLTSCQKKPNNKLKGGADARRENASAEGHRRYRNMAEYQQSVREELAKVTEHANKKLRKGYEAASNASPYVKSGARRRHESAASPVTPPPATNPPVKQPPVTKPAPESTRRASGPLTVENPFVKSP